MKFFTMAFAPLLMAAAPPPPTVLLPYIHDGRFEPGDFGWLRGAFADATEPQRLDWRTVSEWNMMCSNAAKSALVDELGKMGVKNALLEDVPAGDSVCAGPAYFATLPDKFQSWNAFTSAASDAKERFDLLSYGAKLGAQSVFYGPDGASEETLTLLFAPMKEQVFRAALSWQNGPTVKNETWLVLGPMLGLAISQEDQKNTASLEKLVAERGWPSITQVGKSASGRAWLLVQHADHNPAFQLKALRLMEPLVATGDVDKRDYAYLYDRIMLKLTGMQRYGTQFMGCDGGKYKLRPLEADVADGDRKLDAVRASMGLEPIIEYRASMIEAFGPCK